MALGDVALGSSGLGFASRSGSSVWPPGGRGLVGAGAFDILRRIFPSAGEAARGRRESGAVTAFRVAISIPPLSEFTTHLGYPARSRRLVLAQRRDVAFGWIGNPLDQRGQGVIGTLHFGLVMVPIINALNATDDVA